VAANISASAACEKASAWRRKKAKAKYQAIGGKRRQHIKRRRKAINGESVAWRQYRQSASVASIGIENGGVKSGMA